VASPLPRRLIFPRTMYNPCTLRAVLAWKADVYLKCDVIDHRAYDDFCRTIQSLWKMILTWKNGWTMLSELTKKAAVMWV